jgi:hypothetical protein
VRSQSSPRQTREKKVSSVTHSREGSVDNKEKEKEKEALSPSVAQRKKGQIEEADKNLHSS